MGAPPQATVSLPVTLVMWPSSTFSSLWVALNDVCTGTWSGGVVLAEISIGASRAPAGCASVAGTYIVLGTSLFPPTGLAVGLTRGGMHEPNARQPGVTATTAADSPHPGRLSATTRQWVPRSPPSTETTRQGRTVVRSLSALCGGYL